MLANAIKQNPNLAAFGLPVTDLQTGDVQQDSRHIKPGDIFVAIQGVSGHGKQFLNAAVNAGAALLLVETDTPSAHATLAEVVGETKAPIFNFYQLSAQLPELLANYYRLSETDLLKVGVTGTNGKTSTTYFVSQFANLAGTSAASVGTLGVWQTRQVMPLDNTTPGICELYQLTTALVANQCKVIAFEVSSHALVQKRLDPAWIDIAVYTNLSRDHLDYHQTMAAYADAKQQLFIANSQQKWVLNYDDALIRQRFWSQPVSNDVIWISSDNQANLNGVSFIHASDIKAHSNGMTVTVQSTWGEGQLELALLGRFNVDNVLAAMAARLLAGEEFSLLCQLASKLLAVPGRMELFQAANLATTIVDYAHTPDALEKALIACRQHCDGQLWVVFGCGGDRDKGKRPLMGQVAQRHADHVVLTNDNPRSENADQIIADISAGLELDKIALIETNRTKAISKVLAQAKPSDMVLLAGKGHEDYMIIGQEKVHYDERNWVNTFYLSNKQ